MHSHMTAKIPRKLMNMIKKKQIQFPKGTFDLILFLILVCICRMFFTGHCRYITFRYLQCRYFKLKCPLICGNTQPISSFLERAVQLHQDTLETLEMNRDTGFCDKAPNPPQLRFTDWPCREEFPTWPSGLAHFVSGLHIVQCCSALGHDGEGQSSSSCFPRTSRPVASGFDMIWHDLTRDSRVA